MVLAIEICRATGGHRFSGRFFNDHFLTEEGEWYVFLINTDVSLNNLT